jgi:hypothetical protein
MAQELFSIPQRAACSISEAVWPQDIVLPEQGLLLFTIDQPFQLSFVMVLIKL